MEIVKAELQPKLAKPTLQQKSERNSINHANASMGTLVGPLSLVALRAGKPNAKEM